MAIDSFEQLEAWRQSHELVLFTYKRTKTMPADERFGLTTQIRRAAVSVPANIAEGFKRRTSKDKVHFYNISQSSLEELRYYAILCRDLGYWKSDDTKSVIAGVENVGRLLGGLIRAICATS